jgi:perosamine synthetase
MRQIPFGRPMIGEEERAAVLDVLAGPILVHGPRAAQFESDFAAYTGAPHAVSVSSCTAGMHLVYFALGLGAGDEVIVPAQTHAATAHAVELTGATPIFVDAEAETGNIDISAIERVATARTKAVAVVHYLGMPVDMAPLVTLAKSRGWFVLEDCALALGSRLDGVHVGLLGDAGVFSFYPVKHITTAEGGMVVTRDANLAKELKLKKAFGVNRSHGERAVPGVYDVEALGFNYRMSELHAALGIAQLKKADVFLARRKANYQALAASLAGVPGLRLLRSSGGRFESSYYCLSILLAPSLIARRLDIVERLKEQGIGTSVYYPHAVPHLAYYRRKYGYREDSFPVARSISDGSIALPVGPHLDERDMRDIGDAVRRAVEGAAL